PVMQRRCRRTWRFPRPRRPPPRGRRGRRPPPWPLPRPAPGRCPRRCRGCRRLRSQPDPSDAWGAILLSGGPEQAVTRPGFWDQPCIGSGPAGVAVLQIVGGQGPTRRPRRLALALAPALERRKGAVALRQLDGDLHPPARLHEGAVFDVLHLPQDDQAVTK